MSGGQRMGAPTTAVSQPEFMGRDTTRKLREWKERRASKRARFGGGGGGWSNLSLLSGGGRPRGAGFPPRIRPSGEGGTTKNRERKEERERTKSNLEPKKINGRKSKNSWVEGICLHFAREGEVILPGV